MKFGRVKLDEAEGAILAHSVQAGSVRLKKGVVLSVDDVAALNAAGVSEVFAARLGLDDVHEDEAAARIAAQISGEGVTIQTASTGRANIYSAHDGVAQVDAGLVRSLNRLDETITLATLAPYVEVQAGQMVATVKIIPFSVPAQVVNEAEALADAGKLVQVSAYTPCKVGLVLTRIEGMKASLLEKSEVVMRDRVERYGSNLTHVVEADHTIEGVSGAIGELAEQGCDVILVFGASAIVDRGDVVPAGLEAAGGDVLHLGMPVDPGNLLMLGRLGARKVIGVPSCARSPKLNGFDWVLARTFAGLDVRPQDIMDMGAGGLLKEIASRPSPREADR